MNYCCEELKKETSYDNEAYSPCLKLFENGTIGIEHTDGFRLIKHCPFCGISIQNRSQTEKNILELRESRKVISAPGAVLEVTTYKMPSNIQKRIDEIFKAAGS
jgi:hypothetical protein